MLGRNRNCRTVYAPPLMSPPTRFESISSSTDGRRSPARQHTIAKSRREALDLRFDARRHIEVRPVRHMTICPKYVFAVRRARCVEERRLRNQHERPFGAPSVGYRSFGPGNLFEHAAKVQANCATAFRRLPWNGLRKGIVNLECARTVLKLLERAPV